LATLECHVIGILHACRIRIDDLKDRGFSLVTMSGIESALKGVVESISNARIRA